MSRRLSVRLNNALQAVTAKDFRGGWNTFDTDLNLASRFAVELVNLYPDSNGRLRLRYGTSLLADTTGSFARPVHTTYYAGSLVTVGANGIITRTLANGTTTEIWNTTIAASRPGSPPPWSASEFASSQQFAGTLALYNGVDKPLVCNELFAVNYMVDAGSGANTNTPRAAFGVTNKNYTVLAGMATDPTKISIGARGTLFTAYNDPAPTDGVLFEVATYINEGDPDIVALATFRDKLLVFTDSNVVVMTLGTYSGGVHTPVVEDVIEEHGAVSHHAIHAVGNTLYSLDRQGVVSLSRSVLGSDLDVKRVSNLIQTDIQRALAPWSAVDLQRYCYAHFDKLANHMHFVIPKNLPTDTSLLYNNFVLVLDQDNGLKAWTQFTNMNYTCAAQTLEGRSFFGSLSGLHYYHNAFEPLYFDGVITPQAWDDGTLWDDGTGWVEPTLITGQPIPFTLTLPWVDLRQPGIAKYSKYLSLLGEAGSDGSVNATLSMFIDRFADPALSMQVTLNPLPIAGETATRPMNNDQLYAWPTKFTRMKLKLEGSASTSMSVIAFTMHYVPGSLRR